MLRAMTTLEPCPICGSQSFSEFSGRPAALCDGCHALERQRALVREVGWMLTDGAGHRCLEAGPLSARVFGGFLREQGWHYVSIDRWRTGNPADPRAVGFIDYEADLADLSPFAADSFDLVILQHVIEEIERYEDALAEIARVIAPGGHALMEVPFSRRLESTRRAAPNRFGNVWEFGRDLPDRVAQHFGRVSVLPMQEGAYAGNLLVASVL